LASVASAGTSQRTLDRAKVERVATLTAWLNELALKPLKFFLNEFDINMPCQLVGMLHFVGNGLRDHNPPAPIQKVPLSIVN
jgi:hypothetical protein